MTARNAYEWGKAQFCYWCGLKVHYATRTHKKFVNDDQQATRDHLTPRSHGGTGALSNVVVACKRCNSTRGNATNWVPFWKRHAAERGTVLVEGAEEGNDAAKG